MNISNKTAASEQSLDRSPYRHVLRGGLILAVCLCLIALAGCGTFLVSPFFPRTGAHGVVVDQYEQPVTNCELLAIWVPASWGFIMMPPQRQVDFRADQEGRWQFYKRDADDLYIIAQPRSGYSKLPFLNGPRRPEEIEPLESGQCPANDFTLRLHKIEPAQSAKEAK